MGIGVFGCIKFSIIAKMATLLALVCMCLSFNQILAKEFAHSQRLQHSYLLEWNYDDDSITLKLTVKSTSWIGFGLSTDHVMAGADIIMGGVKQGQGYLIDAHALKAGPPVVDDEQDVTLLDSSEIDGVTSLTIKRKYKTGDQFDMDITTGDLGVIWAYGYSDLGGKPKYQNYHFHRRGEAQVNFLTGLNEGEDFKYSVKLRDDEDHKDVDDVILQWFYTEEDITFKYTAPSDGWIGFGFSPEGMMTESDIIIGGINRDERYIYDAYATKNGPPLRNEQQDVELLKVNQDDYVTTIILRRKLKTGNAKDIDIKEGKMHIIWAYGKLDFYKHIDYLNYHGWNRGSKEVELLRKISTTTASDPSTATTTVEDFEYSVKLRDDDHKDVDDVILQWFYTDEDITFKYTAPTSGWIGFGFSPDGKMPGSDVVIGGITLDERYIYDAYSTESGPPLRNEQQDVEILKVNSDDYVTTIIVRRKLITGDVKDMDIKEGKMHILWAYGTLDYDKHIGYFNHHAWNRGTKEVELIRKKSTTTNSATSTAAAANGATTTTTL